MAESDRLRADSGSAKDPWGSTASSVVSLQPSTPPLEHTFRAAVAEAWTEPLSTVPAHEALGTFGTGRLLGAVPAASARTSARRGASWRAKIRYALAQRVSEALHRLVSAALAETSLCVVLLNETTPFGPMTCHTGPQRIQLCVHRCCRERAW